MNNIKIYSIILLMVLINACRPKKSVTTPPTVTKKTDTSSVTAESLLGSTIGNWTYFSSKIEVDFIQNGSSTKASANIRMYKDSLIWVSAGMFGIEGYRVLINKDSMVVLNKLGRNYKVFNKAQLAEVSGAPLSVSQLQNLIIGKPVFALKLYALIYGKDSAVSIKNVQDKFTTAHHYNSSFYTIDSTVVKDKTTPNYAISKYNNYQVVDGINFPVKNNMIITSGSSLAELKLEFSDMDFTTALTFPFTIPSSYEKTK